MQFQNLCGFLQMNQSFSHCSIFIDFYYFISEQSCHTPHHILAFVALFQCLFSCLGTIVLLWSYNLIQALIAPLRLIIVLSCLLLCYWVSMSGDSSRWILWLQCLYLIIELGLPLRLCILEYGILLTCLDHRAYLSSSAYMLEFGNLLSCSHYETWYSYPFNLWISICLTAAYDIALCSSLYDTSNLLLRFYLLF